MNVCRTCLSSFAVLAASWCITPASAQSAKSNSQDLSLPSDFSLDTKEELGLENLIDRLPKPATLPPPTSLPFPEPLSSPRTLPGPKVLPRGTDDPPFALPSFSPGPTSPSSAVTGGDSGTKGGDFLEKWLERQKMFQQVPANGIGATAPGPGPTGLQKPPLVNATDRNVTGPINGPCDRALRAFAPLQTEPTVLGREAEIVGDFLRKCFLPSATLPNDLLDMQERVVVLALKTAPPDWGQCTGFLLDDRTILTAAHCFDRAEGGDNLVARPNCSDMFAVRGLEKLEIKHFTLIGYKLETTDCPYQPIPKSHSEEDLLVVTVDKPFTGVSKYKLGPNPPPISNGTGLYIIGRTPFWEALDKGEFKSTVIVRNDSCRIVMPVDNSVRRMLHQCFAVPTMSGAPIFVRSDVDKQLYLVGIHQGGLINRGFCPPDLGSWCNQVHQDMIFLNFGQGVDLKALVAKWG